MAQGAWRSGVRTAGLVGVVLAARIAGAQCASTTPIACGDTLGGSLSMVGETDCFQFTASANEAVSITTQETAGVFQACWDLVGPGGSLGGVCGQAERVLPDAGTYTIEVFDSANDQIGSYDVNLVFISGTTSSCAEAIACDGTLPRAITAVGQSSTFAFAGLAGDTVSITAQETGGGLSACWELYDPTGASLGGVCGQTEKTLAVPGQYTIRVADTVDGHTGTYDLNLVFVSDTSSSCAEPIACGDTFARTLGNVGQSHAVQFASQAGETVSITAQETAGGTNACWDLYDPQGIPIAAACGQGQRTLAFAGQYTIRVHDDNDSDTGTYDVSLVFVSDTPSNCGEPIACGQTLARAIADVGESRTYRFTALADDTVSITAQETSAFLTACWELYGPDGIAVVGACGQGEKTLATPGDYTIRVYDNGNLETGTYDVGFVVVSDSAASCAEDIQCGDTLARDVATSGESDTFRFQAAAGEVVSVTASETGGFMNACWEIYDPQGISLGGTCGQAEKTLAVAGGYTVRVADNNDVETGTYDVNLVVLSDTAHSCAVPVACGDVASGSLASKGESDTYRIAGQTGDVVAIDTQETGGFLNACWEFYDPSGASLGGVCGSDDRTLATNLGGYTLRVYDSGDNDTGDYQVMLCNPTTTTTTTLGMLSTTTTIPAGGGDQPLSGAVLMLKDVAGKPQKRRLVIVSHDPALTLGAGPGSGDDPTRFGGSLRVRTAAGDGFDATYPLDAGGWRALKRRDPSRGWKFTRGNAVKLAIVKAGKVLRLVGRGAGLSHTLGADPAPVDVVFRLGLRRYCMQFGGTTKFGAGRSFVAKSAPAPTACADVP